MARMIVFPLDSLGPGPTKAEQSAEARNIANRRAELDKAMAECLAALCADLVRKRHRKSKRYGK